MLHQSLELRKTRVYSLLEPFHYRLHATFIHLEAQTERIRVVEAPWPRADYSNVRRVILKFD